MMGYYNILGALEILKSTIRILPRNGKILAQIATLGVLLHSSYFFLNMFLLKPLQLGQNEKTINYLASNNHTESESVNFLKGTVKYNSIIFGVSISYLLIYFPIAIFFSASIVHVSAMSLHDHTLHLKDLLVRVLRSFKRVFITSAHVTGRVICWILAFILIMVLIFPMVAPFEPSALKPLAFVLAVLISIYSIYASVVWAMAVVISVIEKNCYGSEALRKAQELIEGRRVDGVVINIVSNLFGLIIYKVNQIIATKWASKELVTGFFMTSITYLAGLFVFMAYTLLYFKCKESHGEEIELEGKLKYSKIPTTPVLEEDIP